MNSFARELEVCCAAARRAGEIALRHRENGIGFESKRDASPVTVADRECEQMIARTLEEAFPEDGLLGEEGAMKSSHSGRRWIIDPIDGTRDYVRGMPVWSTLIGLEQEDEVVAGVAHFPARGETFWASRGGGAFLNDVAIRISSIGTVSQAVVCVTGLNYLAKYPCATHLVEWMEPFWAVRCYGGCADAMLVARGHAEVWIETQVKPWDLAALKIITEQAGARFFDFAGHSTIYGGNAVVCVPGLEEEVRRFVGRKDG